MVKTLIKTLLVLALLGGGGYWAVMKLLGRGAAAANQPTLVRVERVTRGELIESISASGEVEPKAKVSISARVSARIEKLPFKEGQRVTKGDPNARPPVPPSVLVVLESKELEATLKSAEARHAAERAQLRVSQEQVSAQKSHLDALRVTLADARRELERQKKLLASKDVSQSQVDQLQAKVDQQEAEMTGAEATLRGQEAALIVMTHNIEAAEAEIARARDNLSYTTITSPIDGVVTRLNAEVGEVAMTGTMNNAGTMIMEVADLSQMILNSRVDEAAIAAVEVGQKARIRMEAYREKVFDGTVTNVALANFDPSLSRGGGGSSRNQMDGGRYFKVEVAIDSDGKRILQGLSADVEIETQRYTDVIKVRSQCVVARTVDDLSAEARNRPEADRSKSMIPVVYVYKDGQAIGRPVAIGASDLTHTVIKSGLEEGEIVITDPYKVLETLKDGQKVKVENEAASRPATTSTAPATTRRAVTTQSSQTRPASGPARPD